MRGRDLGGFAADLQREVSGRVPLPDGYGVSYSGQFEKQQRATRRLAVIVPLVLLLINSTSSLNGFVGNSTACTLMGTPPRPVMKMIGHVCALSGRADPTSWPTTTTSLR
jgi:Cu/Ag efflux pump CusA